MSTFPALCCSTAQWLGRLPASQPGKCSALPLSFRKEWPLILSVTVIRSRAPGETSHVKGRPLSISSTAARSNYCVLEEPCPDESQEPLFSLDSLAWSLTPGPLQLLPQVRRGSWLRGHHRVERIWTALARGHQSVMGLLQHCRVGLGSLLPGRGTQNVHRRARGPCGESR